MTAQQSTTILRLFVRNINSIIQPKASFKVSNAQQNSLIQNVKIVLLNVQSTMVLLLCPETKEKRRNFSRVVLKFYYYSFLFKHLEGSGSGFHIGDLIVVLGVKRIRNIMLIYEHSKIFKPLSRRSIILSHCSPCQFV